MLRISKPLASVLAGLLLVLAFVAGAQAQVREATVTAQGSGMTRTEAIYSALTSAAGQAFGVTLEAETFSSLSVAEISDNERHASVVTAKVNEQITQRVRTPSNSPVLGYTINNVTQGIADTWDAEVTLRYARYERLGPDSERRAVVVTSSDDRHREMLVNTVGESIVATRRFDVLSRDNTELFEQEKAFITSDDAAAAEVARLSQAAGADYLVIADFVNLSISNNRRETIRMTGEVLVQSSVSGTLKLQVVEFSSRKVKWSSSEKFGATYKGASSVSQGALASLVTGAADKLMESMVTSIYPIRVVKVMGAVAVINRGEGSVSKGESYAVYLMGEELIDPQSGESLGALELEIGTGKIVDVKPKFSFLKLDEGTLDSNSDYIVRKASKPQPVAKPVTKPRPKAPAAPDRKSVFLN